MRSRFSDGVVIVLLGLAIFTAAVRALPTPPDMQVASASHRPALARVDGKGRIAPRAHTAAS